MQWPCWSHTSVQAPKLHTASFPDGKMDTHHSSIRNASFPHALALAGAVRILCSFKAVSGPPRLVFTYQLKLPVEMNGDDDICLIPIFSVRRKEAGNKQMWKHLSRIKMFTARFGEAAGVEAVSLICVLSKISVFSVTEPWTELLQITTSSSIFLCLLGFSQFINLASRAPLLSALAQTLTLINTLPASSHYTGNTGRKAKNNVTIGLKDLALLNSSCYLRKPSLE